MKENLLFSSEVSPIINSNISKLDIFFYMELFQLNIFKTLNIHTIPRLL